MVIKLKAPVSVKCVLPPPPNSKPPEPTLPAKVIPSASAVSVVPNALAVFSRSMVPVIAVRSVEVVAVIEPDPPSAIEPVLSSVKATVVPVIVPINKPVASSSVSCTAPPLKVTALLAKSLLELINVNVPVPETLKLTVPLGFIVSAPACVKLFFAEISKFPLVARAPNIKPPVPTSLTVTLPNPPALINVPNKLAPSRVTSSSLV